MIQFRQLSTAQCKQALALPAIIVALAIAGWAQASQQPNRLTQELGSGGLIQLPGSVHRLTRKAADMGPVNRGMQLNALSLHFGLSAAQQVELDTLTEAQQDPRSPQYHKWLTQEEYGARFGLSDTDLSKIREWLQAQGFAVRGVSDSRNTMYFSGTATQAEAAFHTQLHRYVLNGEEHFANATELQLPAGLRGVVLVVRGLNDFRPRPRLHQQTVSPHFSVDSSNFFLAPADWATIYDVSRIYKAGFDGTNVHIAVVGQTYVPNTAPTADIDNFRSAAGLGAAKLHNKCISDDDPKLSCMNPPPAGTDAIGDWEESDLDIEWAGAIAKNATVDFVFAAFDDPNRNVIDALFYAVQNKVSNQLVPVISMSYGSCEEFEAGNLEAFNNLGEEAASQGQTIIVSSGDLGPEGCEFGTTPQPGQSVDVPADSPYYTAVGGTTLSGDENGDASQFWLTGNAQKYIPETVWNDTAARGSLSASGGGVSGHFTQPSWQPTPLNYSGPAGRFVPDISFAASPDHDGYLLCSSALNSTEYGNSCGDGFATSPGTKGQALFLFGGTSASAPSFAGMLALMVQKYGRQGSINHSLYAIAADPVAFPSVFHDIGVGNSSTAFCDIGELFCLNNVVPCVDGTTGCVGGTMGFPATTGFDLATGLGSIDGKALFDALAPNFFLAAAAPFDVTVVTGSSTSDTTSLSVSAIGTFHSTVTFSCTGPLPPGVSCVFTPSSLTPPDQTLASSFGPLSTNLTIHITRQAAALGPSGRLRHEPLRSPFYAAFALACLLMGLLVGGNGQRRLVLGLACLTIAGCLLQASCSGGSGGGSPASATPAGGPYPITVTATGGGKQHSTQVNLTVNP